MKQGIHPTYTTEAVITCVCGAVLKTGSTVEKMSTEICSQCHPFYTGKKKFIDAGGRVDRFKKLSEKSAATKTLRKSVKPKAEKKTEKVAAKAEKTVKKEA